MASTEYAGMVQEFYVGFYGRPADPGGLAHWTQAAEERGWSAVREAFANSSEAEAYVFHDPQTGEPYSTRKLVENIYQNLFGRDADQDGLQFYVDKLKTGEMTVSTIVQNVMDGAQGEDETVLANKKDVAEYFTNKVNDKQYGAQQIEQARSVVEGRLVDVDAAEDAADEVVAALPEQPAPPLSLNVQEPADVVQGDPFTVAGSVANHQSEAVIEELSIYVGNDAHNSQDLAPLYVPGGMTETFDYRLDDVQRWPTGTYDLEVAVGGLTESFEFAIQSEISTGDDTVSSSLHQLDVLGVAASDESFATEIGGL